MNSLLSTKPELLYYYKGNRIPLSDFKKELKKLAKGSIIEAVDAVAQLSYDNRLSFNEIIGILRTIITLMIKSKMYTEEELWDYTFSFSEIESSTDNPELVKRIAVIISIYNDPLAANFLKERSVYFLSIHSKISEVFKIAIAISDIYFKARDYENAFRALRSAEMMVGPATEQWDYLNNLRIIREKDARICIEEPIPHYDIYLISSLEAFAIDIALDLTHFPRHGGFYFRKENRFSPSIFEGIDSSETSVDEDSDDIIALKKLKIFKYRKEFCKEYLDFIYNQLPFIYGIPDKYNNGEVEHRIVLEMPFISLDRWDELNRLTEELTKKNIAFLPIEIYNFVSGLVRKYYNMKNT